MQKIIALLLLLSLYVPQAWGVVLIQTSAPTGPTCTGSSTWAGGSIEEFEYGAGDFCNTDITETDSNSILDTYDSAAVLGDAGSYGMSTTLSGTEYQAYVQANLGSGDGDFSFGFYYRLGSGDYTASSYTYIAQVDSWSGVGGADALQVRVGYYSSEYKVRIEGVANSSEITITPTTKTYWITVDYNQAATSTLKVYEAGNGTPIGTATATAADVAPQYVVWGMIDTNGGSPTYTQYFDRLVYDSDGGDIAEP